MGRAKRVTSYIKTHDPELYCERRDGKLCVLRKGQRIESYDVDGVSIGFVRPAPSTVFWLTDNWCEDGMSVEWGLLPIANRLKKIDLWNNRDVAREIINGHEQKAKSRERDLDNYLESYLKDHRREFARATNDINTANLPNDIKYRRD